MKRVFLSLGEYTLGYLIESERGYIFHADTGEIEKAVNKNSIVMKFFTLNRSGMKEYLEIPNHYIQYLESLDREDIISQAGIEEHDSLFVKLYKIAGLKLKPINFGISQG